MASEDLMCTMPIQGGCKLPATGAVIAMPSIDQSGPMRQWGVHLRCGSLHTTEMAARAVLKADPGATVCAFTTQQDLEPAIFAAMLATRLS
jgi:hypothetical protein